jgi:hypothetical protein
MSALMALRGADAPRPVRSALSGIGNSPRAGLVATGHPKKILAQFGPTSTS